MSKEMRGILQSVGRGAQGYKDELHIDQALSKIKKIVEGVVPEEKVDIAKTASEGFVCHIIDDDYFLVGDERAAKIYNACRNDIKKNIAKRFD